MATEDHTQLRIPQGAAYRDIAISFLQWCNVKDREGNGTPLHYSCLEESRDGGAWWGAVYGVAQSRTRLKGLSSNSCSSNVKEGTPVGSQYDLVQEGFRAI